ncbi:hypothetical protein MHYP_G00280130 [Metynnis hypsauchen]
MPTCPGMNVSLLSTFECSHEALHASASKIGTTGFYGESSCKGYRGDLRSSSLWAVEISSGLRQETN